MPRGEIELDSNDLSLSVTGMTCAACVSSVERVLSNLDFVEDISVNLPLEKAVISIRGGVSSETVQNCIEVIEKAGFGAFEILPASRVCLLYTSPSPRDGLLSRMPSSA